MTLVMWDSIDPAAVPANAQACAGYAGGKWPSFVGLVHRFPHLAAQQRIKSIAINASETAHILDVEPGDASPDQAVAWIKRMLALPASVQIYRPGIYADRSRMPAVQDALHAAGLRREQYLLWVADWTYAPHIPAGFDACQWTDKAGGNDASLCLNTFFPPVAPPKPKHPSPFNWAFNIGFRAGWRARGLGRR